MCRGWAAGIAARSELDGPGSNPGNSNPCAGLLQAHRFPGRSGSQISRQSAPKVVRLSAPRTDLLHHQEIFLVLIFVRG